MKWHMRGVIEGRAVPCFNRWSALSILTESWGDVRLVLAADRAGRWVVWCDDTEDAACLLESLPHLHLVGQTQTTSDSTDVTSSNTKFTSQNRFVLAQHHLVKEVKDGWMIFIPKIAT